MIKRIKNYLLRREIKNSAKVKKQFIGWEKVQSAAVIVESEHYAGVKNFIEQSGKNIDVIIFHNDKTSSTPDCFLSVNKKDLNLFDLPKPEVVQKMKRKTYDVLINTDFSNMAKMRSLTGIMPARCKLGPQNSSYSDFFDISIKSSEEEFLKQALKYLMMIKS